jgi:Ger(x)C family germination protein
MSFLLVGCWDEKLFKNLSIVTLGGFEGEIGNMTAYYAYPEAATSKDMKMIIISETGVSPRDVRLKADLKTEQTMNLSALSTLLISDETAKDHDIYEYLDIYFRDVNNPITPRLAIIQGELKPYFELTKENQSSAGEFYSRLIKSLEENSVVIPYNLQTAGSLLFEDAQDLTLPYLKIDDGNRPILDGIALFSGRKFTGEKLDSNQGILLNILNKTTGTNTRLSYLYKESPVSILVNKSERKVNVSKDSIEVTIKIDALLTEYPKGDMRKKKDRIDLQDFLSKKIEDETNEVMKKLQKAKCDAIGLGRIVRAYHPYWYEKEWSEKFSQLDISVKVDVEIVKTGILY